MPSVLEGWKHQSHYRLFEGREMERKVFLRVVFMRSSQDLNLGLFEWWSAASYQLSHWSSCRWSLKSYYKLLKC